MIQVRNVPDRLHKELTRRAKARGQTRTDRIREVLEREVARPPREEVFARIARGTPVKLSKPAAEIIREEREEHEELLERVISLRKNFTVYDAAYVALAELLRAPILTTNRSLAPWKPTRTCRS